VTTYFVTRHAGAVEWARRRGITAELVEHLNIARVEQGDEVIGTLPVQLAAEVCARGARYRHLTLELPREARGATLTADDMDRFGATLEPYHVEKRK